jgi:hypothetical protein
VQIGDAHDPPGPHIALAVLREHQIIGEIDSRMLPLAVAVQEYQQVAKLAGLGDEIEVFILAQVFHRTLEADFLGEQLPPTGPSG